jgi:aromatic-L-amino-acid/L-tryptophan decarboxylase
MSSLNISPAEFRAIAEHITTLCTEYLESLDSLPAFPAHISGTITEQVFRQPLPETGMGDAALAALKNVLEHSRPPSPRFAAYVFGSGDPVSAAGDLFASVLNQNVTAWRSAPAAVTIERTVVDWLVEAVGLTGGGFRKTKGFTGSLCGGGSAANLMGLAMAREAKAPANERGAQPGVIYASTEVHMSIPKAIALLGIGRQNMRLIPVDPEFRMIPAELDRAMAEDRQGGKVPIAVVACGGTVNTGAIDPLAEIAEIAHRHGAWFHVDGAYGALAAIAIPEKFAGLDQADSLSLDPHKWLYQPADIGCLLYKDPGWARVAFSHTGEYTRPLSEDPVEGFAFFEESLELSRRFRALKLWLSLRYHGLNSFREAIRRDLQHARKLRERIEAEPALQMLGSGALSAVCFRYVGEGAKRITDDAEADRVNTAILRKVVHERGRVFISNASVQGKFALRACFVNHRTSERDVEEIVEEVSAAGKELVR